MFCPECGKRVEDDSRFCEHCGHPTENDTKETHIRKDQTVSNKEKIQNSLKDKRSMMVPITIVVIFFILIIGYLTYSSSDKSKKIDVSSEGLLQSGGQEKMVSKKLDVSGEGWVEYHRDDREVEYYKIKESNAIGGNKIVTVWHKIAWTEKGRQGRLDNLKNLIHTWTPKDDETLYTMTLYEIDCTKRRHRTLIWHDCDKDGNITKGYPFDQEWVDGWSYDTGIIKRRVCK